MTKPWIIITGGTGGIGQKLCARAAASGFRPVVGYRSSKAIAEALAQSHGGEAVALNLNDFGELDSAAARFAGEPVLALVLNASPPLDLAPFRAAAPDSFRRQFEAAVVGNHRLLAAIIEANFRPRRSGTVVAVLTKAMGDAQTPAMKEAVPYIAAKYGLKGLVMAAKAEHRWLKVETVSPGYVDTPMLAPLDPRFVELMREQGNLADPDVIAQDILDLITG